MPSSWPLISVIIPAYNCETTIQTALESVLCQTYPNLEIIAIDDGSTDGTRAVIQRLSDQRLRLISQTNAGVSASRNLGIQCSKGELIAFLDADDLWVPTKLTAQFKALQARPAAAVAYSWTDHIDSSGHLLRAGLRCCHTGNVYQSLLLANFLESGSNPLIYRSALETVGGFDPELSHAEDWDMWLRLAQLYEFVVVPEPQVLYRMSSESASCNFQQHEISTLKMLEKTFRGASSTVKSRCLAQFYRYLTFKVLETPLRTVAHRQRGLLALRYWLISIAHYPRFMAQPRVVLSTWLRILRLLLSSTSMLQPL